MNRRFCLLRYGLLVVMALILLFAVSFTAFGLTPFPLKEYVTDNAGLIPEEQRSQLSKLLGDYAKQTGNQILVVTIPGLEGEDLVDFAERMFALNKPGQKGKDNGVILLVALKERKIRIEVGYGLEGPVPDGKAGAIIREQIAPYFKAGDYTSGIRIGVYALVTAITPDYNLLANKPPPVPAEHDDGGSLLMTLLIGLIVIIIAVAGVLSNSQSNRRRFRGGYSESGFLSGDSGGDSSDSSDSDDGFDSGGGDFGGGGASGDW
jgi:uncharacterized protein